jgi:nicotinamidase-related amidase
MTGQNWIDRGRPFLEAIDQWYQALPTVKMKDIFLSPARVAIICVDLSIAFTYEGPLSSPRVAALVPPIVALFRRAYELGVRYFLLPQDYHPKGAVEIQSFPPRSMAGTRGAQTVPELLNLPFSNLFQVIHKNSINSFLGTPLTEWVDVHTGVNTYFVVGDSTDFCVYQLAMHLRVQANAKGLQRRVIVPANCADTYHTSVETARTLGVLPHEGDLIHRLFLYHMAVNGIEVVHDVV